MMFYHRTSERVFFLLPAIAIGIEVDGRYFFEIAWFNFALGLGG